ncbi:aldehyde dehydrogenase family protein [Acinetobacter stercoris]|uniref:Putative aldehyde dehydrogenase AldA n=1 Tax=Acinetobacter stercoris TaxID=2126983 RepID=A0A2U3N3N7_9GAMM|nr:MULTISPECIES: aldehyde dehydrogenase family protein [Acinetobacter]SPL72169.1 putative aldehyde dehydrogenase AldA [Acinetobacter stercoris]
MKIEFQDAYDAHIDGENIKTDKYFPAYDASNGEFLAQVAQCTHIEVEKAVLAAQKAQLQWKQTTYEERSRLLNKLADLLELNIERLAAIDTMDIGRKYSEVIIDYHIAISQYRYFAGAILTHEGFGRPNPNGYFIAKREPIGVVGQIIPWNVPAIMVALKVAPAIAAGNTVILKPDENASISTLEFAKLAAQIFPSGVINVLPGFGEEVGAAITAHPKISKLAFTGSPEVGRIIAIEGAKRLVPVSLELGGKSANIVFPDIDNIENVVDNALFGALYCNGQSCLAGTRLFVHDDIYPKFIKTLLEAVSRVKVGNPFDSSTILSGLVNEQQAARVQKYIDLGKRQAKLLAGGHRIKVDGFEKGYFFEPTIFEAEYDMAIAQEEIFGPVLSVIRWKDQNELIRQANSTPYGLAAGIYTTNFANALKTADALEAGNVWINQYFNLNSGCPFGGVKESGIGSEHCHETLNMYSHLKTITLQNEVSPAWFVSKDSSC